MNTSFDASKSANTINYVGSAYLSAIPANIPAGQQTSVSKLTKVGLKHHSANVAGAGGRQSSVAAPHNNYTDGTAMFVGHSAGAQRQSNPNSHSQGPILGSSHKNLYMSQQERLQEIGRVYNY